jgi:multidrug efflux system membrane fusion protein
LKRAVEAGTLVSAGTLGFTVADTTSVKFVFGAPDVLLGKLRLGMPLGVHVDALGGDVDGSITRIAPSADPKSRVFEIEITIPNADGRLKNGETVAHVRDVTLGAMVGNEVQVLGGLQKGERIVSMGAPLLVDGARVRILPS